MTFTAIPTASAVDLLISAATQKGRNLKMSGEPHYEQAALRPYLGYDQRAGWLVLAEWYWLSTLAFLRVIPAEDARLLTKELLEKILFSIRTTQVTKVERAITNHDILALLREMRKVLPRPLWRWLHLGLTSYDIICTAYALQAIKVFERVFRPKAKSIDQIWRDKVAAYAAPPQCGRTHLQVALPVTPGFWLSAIHSRFVENMSKMHELVYELSGKFSGAVGTSAAIERIRERFALTEDPESVALALLELPNPKIGTQIVRPEDFARFYHEAVLVSGSLAQLGVDTRHLQMTEVGEVNTVGSTSSTMSHKTSNPVAAEQLEGMHVTVRAEFIKVMETLNSTLQRDLVSSSVMRSYNAVLVFLYQQFSTAERLLKSLEVDEKRCQANLETYARLSTSELLHLSLQMEGFEGAHGFVNKKLVPKARESGRNLRAEMDHYVLRSRSVKLRSAWAAVPEGDKDIIAHPERYIGRAPDFAWREVHNELR